MSIGIVDLPDGNSLVVATDEHNGRPIACHMVVPTDHKRKAERMLREQMADYHVNSPI